MSKLAKCSVTLLLFLYAIQSKAHTSEQGFVLLLPTDVYISAGVVAVALTVLILAILPSHIITAIHTEKNLFHLPRSSSLSRYTSLLSFIALLALLIVGFNGPHDPTKNMLPLYIWTIWWIAFVCLQATFGNLWHWVNPWAGVYTLLPSTRIQQSISLKLPEHTGVWPAVIIYIVFSLFALADPAPEDPVRLAIVVSGYWTFTLMGMLLFGGSSWLQRCECFTVLLNQMARLSAIGTNKNRVSIGLPGWQLFSKPIDSSSIAFFLLTLLAIGSFDGFNETFYWLEIIGVNPLNFPGRSAVVNQTTGGLLVSVSLLVSCFALCIWIGVFLANRQHIEKVSFKTSFTYLSASLLPIAIAYHFAHFLTAFLVNYQYAFVATTDPFHDGRDLLGLGRYYVSTGFLNTPSTVKKIWLTQAAAVVIGHVLSVILAHSIAARLWKNTNRALLSQVPLALFMIFYTLLGLWLLAAPRGA